MNNIELCKIFYENLHIYNSLVEYGLDDIGYKSETKDITLNAITNIEKVAQELNLYGDEWKTDLDYLNKYIIPRVNKFFKENIINKINKIKRIEKCFEEFYNDTDKEGHPLNNITRYDVFDSIEDIIQTKPKGDDIMKPISDINNANIEELKKIDIEKIKKHFKQNGFDNWIFDHDLQKWFNVSTNQTIREYLLDNVEMTLSPDILKEYVSELIWHENFDQIISEELTDMQLLSTVISKERTEKGYIVYLIGEKITITPKQWRMIVYEATKRFIRRE